MRTEAGFGTWLKQRRKELGLTRKELAMSVGCSPVTINKIEAGLRRPSKQIADLLAEVLDVPSDERPQFSRFATSKEVQEEPGADHGHHAGRAPWLSLHVGRTNLPAPSTAFIGREDQVKRIRALLESPGVRQLTLTGPPGVGKTRLGLRVAGSLVDRFADGVLFIPLANVKERDLILSAIALQLGVKESGSTPLLEAVKQYLRGKQLLLVLDNFEQLISDAPLVAELLQNAPLLKVLVTSRESLHTYGEHEFNVPPLSLPDIDQLPPLEFLSRFEAVRLFIERAAQTALTYNFTLTEENASSVVQICARLDGLPLAIELAAARIKDLGSPQKILSKLENKLDLLGGGPQDVPPRQQTLRNAISWSYELLSEEEKRVFVQLGVFAGGCTLDAVHAVAGGELSNMDVQSILSSLVAKSLLRHEQAQEGDLRYGMLETIREYALEKLRERGEEHQCRQRHAACYLALVEEANIHLRSPRQGEWLSKLEAEHDNMRSALGWAISSGEIEVALRISTALRLFWHFRNYNSEGRYWLAAALAAAQGLRTSEKADALMSFGVLAVRQGDYTEAIEALEESLSIFRERNDELGAGRALNNLGAVAVEHGDYEKAERYYNEVLPIWRASGERLSEGIALNNLMIAAYSLGRYDVAIDLGRQAMAIWEELDQPVGVAHVLTGMGEICRLQGNYEEAASYYERALQLIRDIDDRRGMAPVLTNLGYVERRLGNLDKAEELIREAATFAVLGGDRAGMAISVAALAGIALSRGQVEKAVRLLAAAEAQRLAVGVPFDPSDRVEYDHTISEARAQVSRERWESLWLEGRSMAREAALEYGLDSKLE
jgi:predicted ATPase/DNA-binding XRE family transcriptional regulator/Flp pilus assembly protein TadD